MAAVAMAAGVRAAVGLAADGNGATAGGDRVAAAPRPRPAAAAVAVGRRALVAATGTMGASVLSLAAGMRADAAAAAWEGGFSLAGGPLEDLLRLSLAPAPARFPRKRLSRALAVLLMRRGYEVFI